MAVSPEAAESSILNRSYHDGTDLLHRPALKAPRRYAQFVGSFLGSHGAAPAQRNHWCGFRICSGGCRVEPERGWTWLAARADSRIPVRRCRAGVNGSNGWADDSGNGKEPRFSPVGLVDVGGN